MVRRTRKVNEARVLLWGKLVGAVAWDNDREYSTFEYEPDFIRRGIEVSPLVLPLRAGVFSFPELARTTFHGLPGLLADALPDKFGNRIIDLWLARQGRNPKDFTPVERLCYIGIRGMGALEFEPALGTKERISEPIEVAELTQLAAEILQHRTDWVVQLKGAKERALGKIIRVGTSAGGQRAKAVIAWNPMTHEVRSGQVAPPPGYESWLLKFDGINDQELGDPQGYGRMEYAYHLMATAAGIHMAPCRLLEENGRAHFMTRRFDRTTDGDKIHMQSFCALTHSDFNNAGAYGYEQALSVIQRLNLGHPAMQEMFRRMVFNIVARNQDDHTRNIAFLMDRNGNWTLSPAFDVAWAYNPSGEWTNRHQMSINGKRDNFEMADILTVAQQFSIRGSEDIVSQVVDAVTRWVVFAKEAGVPRSFIQQIASTHRVLT